MDDDVGIEATQQEVARALFGGRFAGAKSGKREVV